MIMTSPAAYLGKSRHIAQELLARMADAGLAQGETFATEAELLAQFGVSRALHMMLTGEPVTSDYALGIGLVNEVVGGDELVARAHALARLLGSRSAPALATIKRLVYQGIEVPLADALRMERAALPAILGSADYAEGLAAFEEKRPPRFTGTVE